MEYYEKNKYIKIILINKFKIIIIIKIFQILILILFLLNKYFINDINSIKENNLVLYIIKLKLNIILVLMIIIEN